MRRHQNFISITRFLRLLALAVWGNVILAVTPLHAAEGALEYSIKAIYLVKFAGFVEWPASALGTSDSPFVIGVIGDDPFGSELDLAVQGQKVQGRPVVVKRFASGMRPDGIHILFISMSEQTRLSSILNAVQGKNVLTVAEFDPFNIVITFVIDSGKVRFEVNLAQAEKSGLKISSKLLGVARAVRQK